MRLEDAQSQDKTAENPLGLIDTLSAGFRVIRRHAWLVTIPVLLDIWLWLGPQLSIQPLVDSLLRFWNSAQMPAGFADMAASYSQVMAELGQQFNLFWLMDSSLAWLDGLVPRLVDPARFGGVATVVPASTPALLLWTPLLLIVGLGLGSAFLTALVSQVRPPDEQPTSRLRQGLRTWLMAVIYGLVLLVVAFIGLMVFSLGMTAVLLIVPGLSSILMSLSFLLIGWLALWIYLMLYFVLASIALDRATLPEAIWRSMNVVSRNFWSTIALVILTNAILAGFGFIWQRLAGLSPWGTLAGILGNGFLLAGLSATRLFFYHDRYGHWQKLLAARRASLQPPRSA